MAGVKSFIHKHKKGTAFLALVVLSLLLLSITTRNITVRPKEIGQSFLSIFQVSISSISHWIANTIDSIGRLKRTTAELEEARSKLLEYERISRDIVKLRQENKQLKELLGFSQGINYSHVPAEVIARQPGNEFSSITLNKGSKDGVERFSCVVARSRGLTGLVGKVIAVAQASCMVLPLFSESSYVAGRLETTRHDGLVGGQGEQSELLIMRHVNKSVISEIQYGDMVVTSGLGEIFPKDIPIGRIRSIRSESYETSVDLEIEPIIDFSNLEYVLILKPSGD